MELQTALEKLKALEKESYALRHAMSVLYVDGYTAAPKNSWRGRGEALEYLSGLEYRSMADPANGEALAAILEHREQVDEKTFRQSEVLKEAYDDMHLMPMEEYVAYQRLINESEDVWHRAKNENDYCT